MIYSLFFFRTLKFGVLLLHFFLSSVKTTMPILKNSAAIIEQVSPTKIYESVYQLNIFLNFSLYDQLFLQLDKNVYNIHARLIDLKDKQIITLGQKRLFISTMLRNLLRNHQLLKTLFQSSSELYSNNQHCSSISTDQLNIRLQAHSTDLFCSNTFVHTINPSHENLVLLNNSKDLFLRLKNINNAVYEFDTPQMSKEFLYNELQNIILEATHISDLLILEIHINNMSIAKNIANTLTSYDVIRSNNKTFETLWKLVSEISKFNCDEHSQGKIFSISIPIITSNSLTTSYFQPLPIVLSEQTIVLLIQPFWILGDREDPFQLLTIEEFSQNCYFQNNQFLCKNKFPKSINTDTCAYKFLTTSTIINTCRFNIIISTQCISEFIGHNETMFMQICSLDENSWIQPMSNINATNITQLRISAEKISHIHKSFFQHNTRPAQNHKTISMVIITIIAFTSTFYMIAWICMLCKSLFPQYFHH